MSIYNLEEPIMGFAQYNSMNLPFIYQDSILTLLPENQETWEKTRRIALKEFVNKINKSKEEPKWIEELFIYAKSNYLTDIIFKVSEHPTNNNGYLSFRVIYLYAYYEDKTNTNQIDGFSITGREINCFLNPQSATSCQIITEKEELNSINVKLKKEEELYLGKYIFKNTDISIYVSTVPSYYYNSATPIKTESKFKFVFSQSQDFEFVTDIFFHLTKFMFFVCNRTNIEFNDIKVFKIKDNQRIFNGIIKMNLNDSTEENNEAYSKQIINYKNIKDKSFKIFESIVDKTMYFENKRACIDDNRKLGIDSIILNFVAFEREFRNIYSIKQKSRSDEYNEIKYKIESFFEELINNSSGKQKKYAKSFKSLLLSKEENSLGNRLNTALNDCEKIMMPFLKDIYYNYQHKMIKDIADRMNKLRNDSAHGNIDLRLEPIHVSDFQTLEILIYVMRLKHIGLEQIDIQRSIRDLFRYNIMISETE